VCVIIQLIIRKLVALKDIVEMKYFVAIAFLLVCILGLVACGDAPSATKISLGQIEQAATGALAAIPTAEPTATPRPTNTLPPTRTPTPVNTPTVAPSATPVITPTAKPTVMTVVTPTKTATTATATAKPPEGASASTEASAPCKAGQIKGNLNSMIYHVPGQRYYAQTKNNVQCFDREADAVTAGFRKSKV
jgi:hypothetical protein